MRNVDYNLLVKDSCDPEEGAFGRWITSLFSGLDTYLEDCTFEEHKCLFFALLRRLLDEGRVRFIAPDRVRDIWHVADQPPPPLTINDTETHWDVSTDEIIAYLQARWPKSATHQYHLDLNTYFYEIPPIIWRGEDGKWYGS